MILLDTNIVVAYLNGNEPIANKAELVTGNTRHFQNIEGLKLSSW